MYGLKLTTTYYYIFKTKDIFNLKSSKCKSNCDEPNILNIHIQQILGNKAGCYYK